MCLVPQTCDAVGNRGRVRISNSSWSSSSSRRADSKYGVLSTTNGQLVIAYGKGPAGAR